MLPCQRSFFKNGTPLGVAFTNVPEERLHPCVGLRSQGEDVQANLGALPFRVDFEAMVTTFREQVRSIMWQGAGCHHEHLPWGQGKGQARIAVAVLSCCFPRLIDVQSQSDST